MDLMSFEFFSQPTPYPDLNKVLGTLVISIQDLLSRDFVGAYLQGSFAIGDFDIHSDVDFVVASSNELTEEHVDQLQIIHKRVFELDSPWAQHLEGSYFPLKVLRDHQQTGKELWYLEHGASELTESDHCNTIVVRWTVRENGVILAGPPPQTLINPIAVEFLRKEILAVMIDWGQEITADPQRFKNHFYQTFIVLSYCRMLHDLHTGFPGSKRAGAEWVKKNLDPAWADLIDRAWEGRPNPSASIQRPANEKDFKDTLRFIAYITEESQRTFVDDLGLINT